MPTEKIHVAAPLPPLWDTRPVTVRITGLGTAVPAKAASQNNLLQFVLANLSLKESTRELYRKTFSDPSIKSRRFAVDDLSEILEKSHDRINARFEKWAVELSSRSLHRALEQSNLSPTDLDFLITTTCTGSLCPGIGSYLVESCGLRPDIRVIDAAGMGCGAAIPALEEAANFTRVHPGSSAAVVSTEICSAAFFSNDAADIVISNTLFADGSAAAILRSDSSARAPGTGARLRSFSSLTVPAWRDSLRFRKENGYLRNVLAKETPEQAGQATRTVVARLLEKAELAPREINHWIMHAGGRKILESIEKHLTLSPVDLAPSREVLENFGNMSSPTVLFVLDEDQRSNPARPGEWGVLCSFGAGFSAHAALIEY